MTALGAGCFLVNLHISIRVDTCPSTPLSSRATLRHEKSKIDQMAIAPLPTFAVFFIALWVSAHIGAYFRRKRQSLKEGEREYVGVILTATLTLLGLIIGFSFSMAVARYDHRKIYEAEEA